MATAAQQRLKRFDAADQPTLGAVIDEVVDPIADPPADDTAAQHAFTRLANQVRSTFVPDNDPWADSPYAWVKQLPSASRGRAGVALVHRWSRTNGFDVTGRREKGHDLVAGTERLEVKMSTLWASGDYTFQAVRDTGYDTLVLLGISPHHVHLWAVPREAALSNVDRTTGNGWITVPAASPPDWLAGYGGSPAHTRRVLTGRWPLRERG